MTVQAVTVNLPKAIYERLQHVATAVNRPLEEIIFQSIQGNLPPALDDLPHELRQPLMSLQTMSDQELWSVAKSVVNPRQWSRHEALLQKKQNASLSTEEELELSSLRTTVDQLVLRRSYAMALLKWRGYSLAPLLTPTN